MLLGIVVLLLVLAIILPKEIDVTISKTIDTPPQYIYNILNDPSTTELYNEWVRQGDDMTVTTIGEQGVGSGYEWTSPTMGAGKMIIAESVDDQVVAMDIFMDGDKEPMTATYLLTAAEDERTTVTNIDWHVNLGFPLNVMGPIWSYMGKKQFTTTLENLAVEAKRRAGEGTYFGYQMTQVPAQETYYIANRAKVSTASLQQFYSQNLSGIFRILQDAEVQAVGPDCALIYGYDDTSGEVDIAAALPIAEDLSLPNSATIVLPEAVAVTTDYYGNRADADSAHRAIQTYLSDRRLIAQAPYVEEYVTDVLQEKNPEKWLTRVTYRIAP